MTFNNLYENIKSKFNKDFVTIQTDFNRDLSNGWNIFLKKTKKNADTIPFTLYDNDRKKYTGNIKLIGEDFEIEWESEKPLENEGLIGNSDLYDGLKQMVDLINDTE